MRSAPSNPVARHENVTGHTAESPPPSTGRRWWVLAVMCAGMFLVLLDVTVVNVALPAIASGLHADVPELQWIVTAYTVTFAALLLAGGTLGDIFGHKHLVVGGLIIFGVASLGCGLAPTAGWLIIARAGQGIGAAGLLSATLAVITGTFPERAEQAKALGVWAGISSLALPAGPVLGGLLVTGGGWRAVFWINVPIVAAALILTIRMVPSLRPQSLRRLDVPGVIVGGISLAAIVFAVINAGHEGATASTLIATGVAIAGIVSFVILESAIADPVLPLTLLKSATFVGANTIAAAMNFVGIGTIFILTLYLQDVRHYSALLCGLSLLPLFIPLAVLSPITGRLTARVGPLLPMSLGLALGAVGSLCLLLLTPGSAYPVLLPTLLGLGLGFGMGFLTAAVVSAAMRSVPADRAGLASSVNNTARQAAGALGIAVYGAITGNPAHPDAFTSGIHTLAIIGAATWTAALILTLIHKRQPG